MTPRAGTPPRPDAAAGSSSSTTTATRAAPPTRLAGFATTAGTRKYRARFAAGFARDFFRQFPGGLQASSVGIGTYLGDCTDDDDEQYTAAVRRAVTSGINFLDTAINYR